MFINDGEEEDVVNDSVDDGNTNDTNTDTDTTDWKAKFEEEEGRRKRAETKLSKAKDPETETKKSPSKSDGLDFGQLAFYNTKSDAIKIESDEDIDFLRKTIADTGRSQLDLLGAKWFQSELAERRSLKATAEATPMGKRSNGGAIDSVEYWMAKPFEEVPKDMRAKVVQAKLDKENSKGHFYDS